MKWRPHGLLGFYVGLLVVEVCLIAWLSRSPESMLRFYLFHCLLLFVADLVPVACVTALHRYWDRRNGMLDGLTLGTLTLVIQISVRIVWLSVLPPGRSRVRETVEGPILVGIALLPVLSHLVMNHASPRRSALARSVLLSASAASAAIWYELPR